MNPQDFTRLANNFYTSKGFDSNMQRIALDAELINYYSQNQKLIENKFKVAFVFICLNPLYWQYANEMVTGAKELFLPGHNTDYFFWTDIPDDLKVAKDRIDMAFKERGANTEDPQVATNIQNIVKGLENLKTTKEVNIIPTDAVEWPYPTLLRYNLFLGEEQKLKEYDYIFYCDIDMKFVSVVGDEILGPGITAAQHPMYALNKIYWPPYEPNEKSASYIKRPGMVISDQGKPRFMPLYFAGGFQGGKAHKFIDAMKKTKKIIEDDLNNGYIPIWNDETAWNKYLSDNPPETVLTPAYIYPDSLIKEYYEKLWGQSYTPKLVTITKWFSVSKEGGAAVSQMIK